MPSNRIHLANKNFEYILAIAEEGTVLAAAEKLYISQPSLSRFVKNLETRIGLSLFERTDNRLILTPAGEEYVAAAKKIADLENHIEKRLLQLKDEQKKILRLGIPDHWAPYYIPPLMTTVHNFFPEIELKILDNRSSTLESLLLNGEADLVIFRAPMNQDAVTHLFLREDPLYLVVPSCMASKIQTTGVNNKNIPIVDFNELKDLKYILPSEGGGLRRQVELLFDNLGILPNVTMSCRSTPAALRIVSEDFGCCFASETHRRYHGLENPPHFFALNHPSAMLSLHISYARNRILPKYIWDFIELIKHTL